jgi:hypothetical protein
MSASTWPGAAAANAMSIPDDRPRPNLFIVGAPKCGTTWLYQALGQHPDVFMSAVKQPRFWSEDLRAEGKAFHASHLRRHRQSWRGLLTLPYCLWRQRRVPPERLLGIESFDEYLRLFEQADPSRHRYIGEASPDSMWSRTAAARIAACCPDARIVVMLREPLSYIRSIHRESVRGRVGETVRSLDRALALEDRRRAGQSVPCSVGYPFAVFYRAQARFDDQVQRFLDRFERRQMHFVLLEDVAADAADALRSVLAFLELPVRPEIDVRPRNVGARAGPGPGAAWLRRLVDELRPTVYRLQEQTGLPLAARWGYEARSGERVVEAISSRRGYGC